VLATGGIAAAVAIAWMASHPVAGIVLAIVAFFMIGVGVGAAGTTLLVLLAKRVAEHRRAAAATVVWVMMIGGFSVTAGVAGHLLDPFSPARLVIVTTAVSGIAFLLTLVAVWNVEGRAPTGTPSDGRDATRPSFREALSDVWSERRSRRFAVFVFVSMLAYSAQDLILEPFAGTVFGFTPGGSTKLSGMQHGGVLVGMLTVGLVSSLLGRARSPSMQAWTAAGCIASAAALCALVMAGLVGPTWPLQATVFALGATNGIYAVSAIGSMMALVGTGRKSREGVRMGFWGAAQAIAFGLGGSLGTLASDGARAILHSSVAAYATVFSAEALLFLASAVLAIRLNDVGHPATLAAASRHGRKAAGDGDVRNRDI